MRKIIQLIQKLCKRISFPLHKTIVFESNPEMTGNTGAVFQEMIKREINKNYTMVWQVEDRDKYSNYHIRNVKFINYKAQNKKEEIYNRIITYFSKVLIYENRIMCKRWKNQKTFYLMHGMPIKCAGNYKVHNECDFVISSGSALNKIISNEIDVSEKCIVTLGYPRTDILNKKTNSLQKLQLDSYQGVIVWMPTFRKHKGHPYSESRFYPSGIPILTMSEDFDSVNNVLKQCNYALIVKLHPVQDMTNIRLQNYSNIYFMSDCDLESQNTNVYELLAESSALLTDYSSVYYDYLLTDKPIGLVFEDIKEFENKRGLVFSNYKEYIKGNYITNLNELLLYIENVSNGIDTNMKERQWAKKKWCDYDDFKSTERVTDFILNQL